MTVESLKQLNVQSGSKAHKFRGAGAKAMDFSGMLDAVNVMGSTVGTAAQMYGGTTSQAVLAAAFSGIGAGAQQFAANSAPVASSMTSSMSGLMTMGDVTGGITPSIGAGTYSPGAMTISGSTGLSDANSAVVDGTTGFSQMDMINTMNQNSLKLLELQAVLQSHSQGWSTKSNILQADHRARMTFIEKFSARA